MLSQHSSGEKHTRTNQPAKRQSTKDDKQTPQGQTGQTVVRPALMYGLQTVGRDGGGGDEDEDF